MLKWLQGSTNFILAGSLALAPARALAEDAAPPTAPAAVELVHNGERGVWFPIDMAREIQADVEELRVLRAQAKLYDLRIDIEQRRIATLKEALRLSMESEEKVKGVVATAVRGRREAEEARHSWLAGQPGIWGLGGALVGVLTTAIIVSQVK